ncbi:MAG: tetratricopeptide repeat protein [Pseudomonadota bacterium]
MSAKFINLKDIVAALCVTVMISGPLPAQTADLQDESELLERLSEADPAEASRLDRQLQALWGKSGSAAMDLLLKRGRDALEVDNVEEAIEHLTALTDHAPDFAEGWHMRASAYFEAELFGPALADLERALSLNPNNYNAIYGLGAILETFGEDALAYDAYTRVLAIHPHHEEVTKATVRLETRIQGNSL